MRLPLALVTVLLIAGCSSSSGSADREATQRAARTEAAAELAAQACGLRTDAGGPPALMPIGQQWQPSIGAFDASRLFADTNAVLAGKAAARDASWAAMAAAMRDLAEIYDTARAEYAAVLARTASPGEQVNLRALQGAATVALATANLGCARLR